MRVRIARSLHAGLLAEAAASPGREVCGLLFGARGRIESARVCGNVAAWPERAFELDPAALLAAHRQARGGGPALIGHYHSHPIGRAEPSPTDAAAALDAAMLWLIVAGGEVRAWRVTPGGTVAGRFAPVELVFDAACARDPASPQAADACPEEP